jgi:selenocysteine lyase/cysteine desulfurase
MTKRIDYSFVTQNWPALLDMTYLNTASTGVISQPVVEAMNKTALMRSRGEWQNQNTADMYAQIKQSLSNLIGGSPQQYAFVPSTSMGMNVFGHSIEYPTGSNIVLCDLEFPSNYIPWQNISKRYGVELRVVESENGAAPTSQFEDKIDDSTRVVAVSHVQFGSGFRSNLKELARIAHDHGALLAADVIQSVGCKNIDLEAEGVDFAAGQATKWIAGPIGAGYAYVDKDLLPELNPIAPGWRSVKDHRTFEYYERESSEDASKLEGGSVPLVVYSGFAKALELLLELDDSEREFTAKDNGIYLRKRLAEEGIEHLDFGEEHNSPIVSCLPDNVDTLEVALKKDKIYSSVRNGRLRVSPHFYNTYKEVDALVSMLV